MCVCVQGLNWKGQSFSFWSSLAFSYYIKGITMSILVQKMRRIRKKWTGKNNKPARHIAYSNIAYLGLWAWAKWNALCWDCQSKYIFAMSTSIPKMNLTDKCWVIGYFLFGFCFAIVFRSKRFTISYIEHWILYFPFVCRFRANNLTDIPDSCA